jgi:tyrosinase
MQDDSGNTVSNDAKVNDAIANQIMSIQGNVYLIMSSYTDFAAFSNTRWDQSGNPGTYGSLEDIHDDIHGTVGGGGHMSDPDYSAFDPVFWLHHCTFEPPTMRPC